MKKKELVHLHGLFAEVGRYYEQETDLSIDFSEYESLETDVSSIHRCKSDHQEAVFALTDAITENLRDEQTAVAPANAD